MENIYNLHTVKYVRISLLILLYVLLDGMAGNYYKPYHAGDRYRVYIKDGA